MRVENMHWIRSDCVIVPLSIELTVFYYMSTEIYCKQTWQRKMVHQKLEKSDGFGSCDWSYQFHHW